MTSYTKAIERTRRQFQASVSDHQMTVVLDNTANGTPHRHIHFGKPGTYIWSFNLLTWPGALAISGDLQDLTFRRLNDMFQFFASGNDINPSYWGEKVTAGVVKSFSQEVYAEEVRAHVSDLIEWGEWPKKRAKAFRAVVEADLLECPPSSSEEAWEKLDHFRFDGIRIGPDDLDYSNFEGYDHHFLLACHAIRWGVRKYLAEFPDRLVGGLA